MKYAGVVALLSALLPWEAAQAESTGKVLAEQAGIPWPAVIAHRGASHDAPESTRPAYLLARDLGVDYLELDLQRTRDGVLIALHDDNLLRTSDVAEKFPERKERPVSDFTLAELKSLDAGAWFNAAHPERARPSFEGLRILTLDEVIDIAEGGEHKPGLYIETKLPQQFPGIEKDLRDKLAARGWLDGRVRPVALDEGRVTVAYSPGRVVLQTFEKGSLELLAREMPEVPKILLLWVGDGYMEAAPDKPHDTSVDQDKAAWYARQRPRDRATFESWLDFAARNGAVGTGPSAALAAGGKQSYMDLTQPWMNRMTQDKGMLVHVYTVDDEVDFARLSEAGVDGFFSNRPDALLRFVGRAPEQDVKAILERHGY
ncbi:glycerophosphodiester phosphodiesterase [Zestomonas carbonaria]|uniref:Glycerophosphodiester phosphodiesterase n=1 Tax=Zestomonas carbonaria TaxID=2762745 RepID=A0A7U7EIZ7_9GAMM|nr:glycerophosphodiester phosphodiesterase [Pseudomonas carbonaria]CAD5105938.1 Glycerophosphodiester phosphodiesterase [Pseudomonas carbonaria]